MDIRARAAAYYDAGHFPFDDVPFYLARIPSASAHLLELGCGTGRVLVPLTAHCEYIQGVDISAGMLEICKRKLTQAGIPPTQAQVVRGDITSLHLQRKFDLITSPFRVFQNLTEDEHITNYFATVRRHLAAGGTAILNTFRPFGEPSDILARSRRAEQEEDWDIPYQGGHLLRTNHFRKPATAQGEKLVIYPSLTYRYYEGEELVHEAIMDVEMRVHYPDQLIELITRHGFAVIARWGGYQGEQYGQGPELVVQFGLPA